MVYVKNLSFIVKNIISSQRYDNTILIARDKEELTLKVICDEIKKNTKNGRPLTYFTNDCKYLDFLRSTSATNLNSKTNKLEKFA